MGFGTTMARIDVLNALVKLNGSLRDMGDAPNSSAVYDYSVGFFNSILLFNQRCRFDVTLFPDAPGAALHLGALLNTAGGRDCGWVRAAEGEFVTLSNLYLGNVAGLGMRPAFDFKRAVNDEYKQAHIQYQLRSFLRKYRNPIIEVSDELLARADNMDKMLMSLALIVLPKTW